MDSPGFAPPVERGDSMKGFIGFLCTLFLMPIVSSLVGCASVRNATGDRGIVFLGNPYQADYAATEEVYARNIWDMQLHKGRIYIGAGNSSNIGPAPNAGRVFIYSIDTDTDTLHKEYEVAEEQIDSFRIFSNRLYVPGHDATQTWDFGNFYLRDPLTEKWKKNRTIPHALHVYDMLVINKLIYAAGSIPEYGAVFASADGGMNWTTHQLGPGRVYTLFKLGGIIFASQDYRTDDKVSGSLFRYAEPAVFVKIEEAKTADVFPDTQFTEKLVKIIRHIEFEDSVFFIGAYVHNDHQNRPFGLYRAVLEKGRPVFTRIGLEGNPRDILVRGRSILVLTDKDTEDGSLISVFRYDPNGTGEITSLLEFGYPGFARSFEEAKGSFYFGMGSEIPDPNNWSSDDLGAFTGDILKIPY